MSVSSRGFFEIFFFENSFFWQFGGERRVNASVSFHSRTWPALSFKILVRQVACCQNNSPFFPLCLLITRFSQYSDYAFIIIIILFFFMLKVVSSFRFDDTGTFLRCRVPFSCNIEPWRYCGDYNKSIESGATSATWKGLNSHDNISQSIMNISASISRNSF